MMAAKPLLGKVLRPCSIALFETHISSKLFPISSVCVQQIREKSRSPKYVVRPTTRRPWHVRKWTTKQDASLTSENETFVQDVIKDQYLSPSPLKEGPWERNDFQNGTRRTGALALKLGVIKQWTNSGKSFYVTLLQILDNHVINYVPPAQYSAYPSHKPHHAERFGLQIVGALSCDPRQFSKAYNNLFVKAGVPPKRWLTRFLITPDAAVEPGTALSVNHFRVGDFVDVQSRSKDWGFQGVIKRWGMKGMPASHGVTKSHRKMGGTGGGGDKDGIWRGKRMPGVMGNRLSTQFGLKIWRINTKYNILYVTGPAVAGVPHTFCRVKDTVLPKKCLREDRSENVPMPTWFPEDLGDDPQPEEIFDKDLFQFTEPSLVEETES
ncbi:39S ribosomal protein L3, mitochondrial [Aplysia californica]|uniref:Large ribosomal subunit protein uL3m n=1 Tax=Aplysia californica TaxID=6500 RepID=A0ABM1A563_APLCA|nr:39S ribosomal protein L3, mitochondrial [Aplysia californica]